jgi:hypothetical protein
LGAGQREGDDGEKGKKDDSGALKGNREARDAVATVMQ